MNENKKSLGKVSEKRTLQRKTKKIPSVAPQKLKLLFTIVNRSKAEFYMDLLQGFDINMQISRQNRNLIYSLSIERKTL